MLKPKVITGFSRYSDGDLSIKAKHIVTSLTGNSNYATPTPTLSAVSNAITAFDSATEAAVDGDKQSTALKKQKREELEALLNNLSLYVQLNGQDDEVILLSSGFDLKKAGTPVGVLPKPASIKVSPGDNSGSVKVVVAKVEGAKTYLFEYTLTPVTSDSVWTDVASTKTTAIIDNLISGKQYAFRVAGVGADTTLVYSDFITSFIL